MHIHLPKPLHGWRALLGEIGVVFVGIVLALGAEALLQDYHWHQQAKISEDAIKRELKGAGLVSYERLILQPCLHGQLSRLATALTSGSTHWTAMSMATSTVAGAPQADRVIVGAYRPPSRLMGEDGWRNAISVGALNHMDARQVAQLTSIYASMATWLAAQDEEASAASQLAPLAFDGSMDDRRRSDMIAAVAEVDRLNSLMAIVSQQMIDKIRRLGLGYSRQDLSRDGVYEPDYAVKIQREARGACVRDDLKLDLG